MGDDMIDLNKLELIEGDFYLDQTTSKVWHWNGVEWLILVRVESEPVIEPGEWTPEKQDQIDHERAYKRQRDALERWKASGES